MPLEQQSWKEELHWLTLTEPFPTASRDLLSLQAMIIDANDPALAFFFARDTHFQAHKMQAIVLQATNPLWAVLFAAYIPNADIKALQAKVLSSNDLQKAVEFACYVPNADVRAVERAVIKAGSAKAAATLLAHSDCASVSALQRTILTRGAPAHLLELARHLRGGKALRQIEDILVAKKAVKHCRLFAQEIKGADIERLEQVVLDSGNTKEIKALATNLKGKRAKGSKVKALSVLF